MRLLFIGDIVARPGRQAVKEFLPEIIKTEDVDFVIANAENLAHGRGATEGTIIEMQNAGVDFFTGGDHLFWHKDFEIEGMPVIRPANLPDSTPGKGFEILNVDGIKLAVINIMGQSFINEPTDNPFYEIDDILNNPEVRSADIRVVDFHGETTSDKLAFGFYVDGRVDVVCGTHTHIPTADERILPKGTLYITDIGMTGNIDSVLGVKKEIIIDRMAFGKKQRFEWELEGRKEFRSVLADTEKNEIYRVDKKLY